MRVLCCTLLLLIGCSAGSFSDTLIDNVDPRRDDKGTIMDIHDGNTWWDAPTNQYMYFGASYGDCIEPKGPSGCAANHHGGCGFKLNHNVSLYTSPNFQNWTFQGHIFSMAEKESGIDGILFCPKVIYNKKTSTWVLWFNYIANGSFTESLYAVATSKKASGPYKIVSKKVTTLAYTNTGDFNLMVDDDGTGYIIYTSHIDGPYIKTHRMSVEELTDDYLATKGKEKNSGFFGHWFVEAPSLFRRNSTYYAIFGECCCYCDHAAPVYSHTADHPLGPWKTLGPLWKKDSGITAQQTNVAAVRSEKGWSFVWQGDRWQSAPHRVKGHDFSYWGEMEFEKDGTPKEIQYQPKWKLAVNTTRP